MYAQTETFYDAAKRTWSGPRIKHLYGSDATLGEVALLILSRTPEKVIQVSDSTGEEVTAGQMLRNAKAIAWNLQRLGLSIGDVVGVCATNTTHLASVLLGALLCGTPWNALFPDFDKETIKIIYKVTNPKIVFCDISNYETIKESLSELQNTSEIILMNGKLPGVRNVQDLFVYAGEDIEKEIFPCSKLNEDDAALLLCSSGTTGPPKGVICPHSYLIKRPLTHSLSEDSVVFSFSTMYWASGLLMFVLSLLHGVKRVITEKPFTPEYLAYLVEKYRITDMLLSAPQLVQLVRNPKAIDPARWEHVRMVTCGGSKVPQVATDKMNNILGNKPRPGLSVGYGMSECMVVSINTAGPGKRHPSSEGKLVPNIQVRIVGENGELLRPNEQGIIHLNVGLKWSGYYRNPEATQRAYVNGWYDSGDVGYFDDLGHLHICARDSEIFKSNNFQIHPQQVEEFILRLTGVFECCVFGLPDLVASSLIACAVVRANNKEGRSLNSADIESIVENNMAKMYHLTGGVYYVDSFPKSVTGKIQRRKVLESVLRQQTKNKEMNIL